MTIDEAIQYLYEIANKGGDECDEEDLQFANQLAKWLEELKRHRRFMVNKDIKNPLANISGYVCHHCDHKDEYIIEYEDTGLTPKQIDQMKQENAELKRQIEKLAAYEDTGLTPDEIEHVKHTNDIRKNLLAEALKSINYLDKELSKRLEREKEMERLDRAMHMDTLDEIEMYKNLLQTCEDRF